MIDIITTTTTNHVFLPPCRVEAQFWPPARDFTPYITHPQLVPRYSTNARFVHEVLYIEHSGRAPLWEARVRLVFQIEKKNQFSENNSGSQICPLRMLQLIYGHNHFLYLISTTTFLLSKSVLLFLLFRFPCPSINLPYCPWRHKLKI